MTVDATPAIFVTGLRKEYGRKVALHELTLAVPRGEVFGFLGPNGAGKTTAVKLLTGLAKPTSGRGELLGRPLGDLEARRRLGFLPELFRFHEWLSANELLSLHADLFGMAAAARRKRIPEVLDLVGLADRGKDRVGTFSKGMQQRLGLAQALLNQPELVILDEPTSALDPIGRRDVRVIIQQLKSQGVAVFLNSHLLSEIELVCDRVAIVDHGRVVQEGKLDELLALGHELELRVAGLTDVVLDQLRQRWTVRESSKSGEGWRMVLAVSQAEEAAEVTRFLVSHFVDLLELRPRRTNLEDLFLQWVQAEEGEGGHLDLRPADAARSVA
ncbi:MAG TPA: ABC transporter ATP-binding protein [Chloroflexota bacterium]|nr:ABC transporter ATP-binding protein [Chloroflexota bacterium]